MNRWPVTIELPVQWGDMDSFGHVNNVVYLRWFESARIAFFERAGMLERMAAERVGPILARQIVDYRIALQYPDTVRVSATALRLGTTSFTLGLRMRSRAHGRAIAAEGENVIVMLDYGSGKKVPLGDALQARIAQLEASAPEQPLPDADA
jgi:acyl-CoA thioester hydrolase